MRLLLPTVLVPISVCAGLAAQDAQATAQSKPTASARQKSPKRSYALIKTSLGDITLELFDDETPRTVANFLGLAEGTKAALDPSTGKMSKRHFYDGLIFHRVIAGFMAQTGCPSGNGRGGPGYQFGDEISAKALGLDKIMLSTDGKFTAGMYSLTNPEWRKVMAPIYDEFGVTSQADLDRYKKKIAERLDETTVLSVYKQLGFQYDDTRGSHRMRRGTVAMANSGPGSNGSQFFINFKNNEFLNGKHTVFGKVVAGMSVVDEIGKVKTGQNDKPVEDVKVLSIRRVPAPKPPVSRPGTKTGPKK